MKIKFEEELQRLIAERARELSSQRLDEYTDSFDDWLQAEQEIMSELDNRPRDLLDDLDLSAAV